MPNRLAAEKSPYLLQHAENPVAWWPWGEEAFAQARAEGKPVFLSIGYSTCHWCHVMAHESFEDEAVAAVLNEHFVSIKLDREERPDVDRVYMTYVQQTTGHGGWPMSVWLTPEGKPFFGGTYFPPADRQGRPGFVTVLRAIARQWGEDRARIEGGAEEVVQALRRYAAQGPAGPVGEGKAVAPLHEAAGEAFERGFQYFYEAFDAKWGGFGGAPKFPRASVINFLLRIAALQGADSDIGRESIRLAAETLRRMAQGGIQDHVGGGFHRYSVDERWHVPHFEKMLYDQAQIAINYLDVAQATGIEAYAWVARDIFAYVARDLTGPHGGFYSAEDADSAPPPAAPSDKGQVASDKKPEKVEGAFYVWTQAEIEGVLGEDAAFFCAHFGVKPEGNVVHDPHGDFTGRNVLMAQRPLAESAQAAGLTTEAAVAKLLDCRARLRAARARRPRPHLDDKVITAWNGLMISALARGEQVLAGWKWEAGAEDGSRATALLPAATKAAEFVERELYDADSGTLFRTWRDGRSDVPGFAEDYAYLIQGLLDLYEAGFEIRWLQWAERLQARMDELFWDAERGGYFNSRADDPAVILRLKEDYDGAEPAPGSVAAMNLLRLDWMLGTPGARDRAVRTLEAMRGMWTRAAHALPQALCAMELALIAPRTVLLAGKPGSHDWQELVAVIHAQPGPRRVLLAADGGEGQAWLAARREYIGSARMRDGRPTAYLCEDYACGVPVSSAAGLRRQLAGETVEPAT